MAHFHVPEVGILSVPGSVSLHEIQQIPIWIHGVRLPEHEPNTSAPGHVLVQRLRNFVTEWVRGVQNLDVRNSHLRKIGGVYVPHREHVPRTKHDRFALGEMRTNVAGSASEVRLGEGRVEIEIAQRIPHG